MTEFIGARISLVSRSDIRYVGTLHEINSNDSTVALENVTSYGTEGRKANPDEEIPASDSVYEYIVFRGSDVKDLRVEEKPPAAKENKPPNDPAILGSGSRPPQSQIPQPPRQGLQGQQHGVQGVPGVPGQQGPLGQQQGSGVPPRFDQHAYPPQFYPPPGSFGRGGPPGPGGFPPMPFGAPPPGWYAPPNQGFPPAPFPPYGFQQQYPGQFPAQNQPQLPKPAPIGPGANKQATPPVAQPSQANEKQVEQKTLAKPPSEMPAATATKPPTPPAASKPTASEVQAVISQPSTSQAPTATAPKAAAPSAPKNNRVITPVLPLQPPTAPKAPLQPRPSNAGAEPSAKPVTRPVDPTSSLRDATQAATAAVAAAMAKLPPPNQTNGNAVDNLTRKVNEMRVNDAARAPRNPGGNGFAPRGGRGGQRGGRSNVTHKVEVPETDFDFASANAKFNKQDLVKEAIAGSPLDSQPVASPQDVEVPVSGYNKATSFFDNISSEAKERAEGGNTRPGGREWRGEEQKKNVETFGQGSVDNGYRGGYRGRGRGRGRGAFRGRGGYSGNGQPGQGRGSYRGRGDAQAAV